jgi:hypothetical protein
MNQIETARHCLRLIRDIADRGAASSDPANVGYVLQELPGDSSRGANVAYTVALLIGQITAHPPRRYWSVIY